MVKGKNRSYKYCIVPMCKNTTSKTPDKYFFRVPTDIDRRKKWCKLMKRDIIGPTKYVCEDHFDIENDIENLIRYRLIGGNMKLKPNRFPHKFDCQKTDTIQVNGYTRTQCMTEASENTDQLVSILEKNCDEDSKSVSEEAYENLFITEKSPSAGSSSKNELRINQGSYIEIEMPTSPEVKNEAFAETESYEHSTVSNDKTMKRPEEFDEYDYFALMIASKIRKIKNMDNREIVMNSIQNLTFEFYMKNKQKNLQIQSPIQAQSTATSGQPSNRSVDDSRPNNIEENIINDTSEPMFIVKVENDIDIEEPPSPDSILPSINLYSSSTT